MYSTEIGIVWGPGAGKKWSTRRRMQVRAKGLLHFASGETVRSFQFPGSRYRWHRVTDANDNGRRLSLVER